MTVETVVMGSLPVSVTHLVPRSKTVGTRLTSVGFPDQVHTADGLTAFGEQLVRAMCGRHRQPELTFRIPRERPTLDDAEVDQLFVWRPERASDKSVASWSDAELMAATVVNALCRAVPGWCEAIGRRSVRCTIDTDGTLVTIGFSFKRPLHPHRLRPDLVS